MLTEYHYQLYNLFFGSFDSWNPPPPPPPPPDADDKVDEEVDNSGEGKTCDTGNIAESNNKVNKYEGGNNNNTKVGPSEN